MNKLAEIGIFLLNPDSDVITNLGMRADEEAPCTCDWNQLNVSRTRSMTRYLIPLRSLRKCSH
jgi:hypothetical protein